MGWRERYTAQFFLCFLISWIIYSAAGSSYVVGQHAHKDGKKHHISASFSLRPSSKQSGFFHPSKQLQNRRSFQGPMVAHTFLSTQMNNNRRHYSPPYGKGHVISPASSLYHVPFLTRKRKDSAPRNVNMLKTNPAPSSTHLMSPKKEQNFAPLPYTKGPMISPSPSIETPKNKIRHHASPGLNVSPAINSALPPTSVDIIGSDMGHYGPPSIPRDPSQSQVPPPFSQSEDAISSTPPRSPSYITWQIYPPEPSPSTPSVQSPKSARVLPLPPPNSDCVPMTCQQPLTNPSPGSLCTCVLPIKVELRLGISLYTFFPLVSEFAKEIALGILMKQSQVRIMGANSAPEDYDKTDVLIDLVPLGKSFKKSTVLVTSVKFWKKQVAVKASYFGEYDVLYVSYPGLPPPPTEASYISGQAYARHRNSTAMLPFAVDVRTPKEKLRSSLIVVIVLSSVIALFLIAGVAWLSLLRNGFSQNCQSSQPPFTKSSEVAPGNSSMTVELGTSSTSESPSSSLPTYRASAKVFTLAELERSTNSFDDSQVIGEGGFGRVYQGILEDGTGVAVKVLKRDDGQGEREFLVEIEMLSRLHHRNLVKLIGICTEKNAHCLVYELIPNGSVESHLHGIHKETAPLDWNSRMKIALGAARALTYLHEDSNPSVIHRDFKSSNILLEHDFTPRVSDFGLARTASEGREHIFTQVMGTFGYLAPEYAMTGHLLVKSDVYSYGVVLLELLTGKKPIDMSQPPGRENLVAWTGPLLTNMEALHTIIDPAIQTQSRDVISKVAAIASTCVQPQVSHRPLMSEVVQALRLVCQESDEFQRSRSCNDHDGSAPVDVETRINIELREGPQINYPEADMFYSSSNFALDASSGSFRWYSSSGPITTGRSMGAFWKSLRGFVPGSTSEHGFTHGFTHGFWSRARYNERWSQNL
ncbi:hypothetical protein HPP92_008775 [Vanilla planifolia]|uniref:Protein kinase domain-containing protein n=1 Tax=Vanilla planifolia TaxID=51239 RepID=A0A835R8Q2_VANPL|nr:hypothetical protein HPP92_008775 [Vanilla planifolia]